MHQIEKHIFTSSESLEIGDVSNLNTEVVNDSDELI
jgi:hypothetical protein